MLVICNGNVKSGSTWLVQIVRESRRWKPIPDKWRDPTWQNPSVPESLFADFIEAQPWHSGEYFCKQHWMGDPRHIALLEVPAVKIVLSIRDIRDALVSRYFFDKKIGQTTSESISDYYFNDRGRGKAHRYIMYHKFWTETPGVKPHLVRYEALKTDFDSEVGSLFDYLGAPLTEEQLTDLKLRTDFGTMRSKSGGDNFMRKGNVGDYTNHLDDSILQDLSRMCESLGFTYGMD